MARSRLRGMANSCWPSVISRRPSVTTTDASVISNRAAEEETCAVEQMLIRAKKVWRSDQRIGVARRVQAGQLRPNRVVLSRAGSLHPDDFDVPLDLRRDGCRGGSDGSCWS